MRALLIALACLISGPALSDYVADYSAAEADGFEPVEWVHVFDPTAQILARQFVNDWMEKAAPGASFGFSYEIEDLNADGFGDAIVSISTPAVGDILPPGAEGSPVLVAYKMGRGYVVVAEDHAVDVALRPLPEGGFEVAFIEGDGLGYRTMGDWR